MFCATLKPAPFSVLCSSFKDKILTSAVIFIISLSLSLLIWNSSLDNNFPGRCQLLKPFLAVKSSSSRIYNLWCSHQSSHTCPEALIQLSELINRSGKNTYFNLAIFKGLSQVEKLRAQNYSLNLIYKFLT